MTIRYCIYKFPGLGAEVCSEHKVIGKTVVNNIRMFQSLGEAVDYIREGYKQRNHTPDFREERRGEVFVEVAQWINI